MLKYILQFSFLLCSISLSAQDNIKISAQTGIKEKLIRIKKGLPNIKKNLTVQDEMWTNERNVKFEMGDGIIIYSEDEDEGIMDQLIRITFSYHSFSGTLADYQDYYKKLVDMFLEIFGNEYEASSEVRPKSWNSVIHQRGARFNSPVWIFVEVDWFLGTKSPSISIEVHSKQIPKKP